MDPQERMREIFDEISRISQIHFQNPEFGVDYAIESISKHDQNPAGILPMNGMGVQEGNNEEIIEEVICQRTT